MLSRRSLVLGAAAASALAATRPAKASSLASFSISSIAPSVWPFAVWPSTSQKVARNKFGTFFIIGTQCNAPTAAYPTVFTLFWDKGDGSGPQTIWTDTLPTNMCNLEVFESGELHVLYANIASTTSAGILVDLCWPDVTASVTPNTPTVVGPSFGNSGKTGTVVDDARRCIHVVGLAGNYVKVSAAGVGISQQALFAGTINQAEYFDLTLDEAGFLYVTCMTATSASPPEYDMVFSVMSPNPGDLAPLWFAGSLVAGTALTLPINPTSGAWITLGEQQRRNNNYLIGATVSGGRLHSLIGQTPALSERGYKFDDLRDLTVEAVSMDWDTAVSYKSADRHRPLRGQTLFPKCVAGGIAQRESGLYAIVHDRTNLLALVSKDEGKSWRDYAQTSLLPYLGSGTDVSTWWTPRDLGIMRGNYYDADIIGMFTTMQCSPSAWANAAFGFSPPSSTYTFSLPT